MPASPEPPPVAPEPVPSEPVLLDRDSLAAVLLRGLAPDAGELTVALPAGRAAVVGEHLPLQDDEGAPVATLVVSRVGGGTATGRVSDVRARPRPDHAGRWLDPGGTRALLRRRGVHQPLGVLTGRAMHGPDVTELRRRLTEHGSVDGVLVLLLAGASEPTDARHHDRVEALQAVLDELPVPAELVLVAAPDDDASARVVARAYGTASAWLVPPLDVGTALALGKALDSGVLPPEDVSPASVVRALARRHRPRRSRGLVVLFSGLSGSGKSTLAGLLAARLMETGDRPVTVLDGDRVRRHLTAGLGFSRADRDTNVRRIGWVAAQVAGAGGLVVCAPIAPYDATRREVQATVEDAGGGFVLVHVATPLEECERRDRKGLYAKARAGLIPEFTGVSDPYEVPEDAQVVVDTTGTTPRDALAPVLEHLQDAGWLA